MGTETIVNIAYECQIPQSIVKLNNPLMGTETFLSFRTDISSIRIKG